MHRSTLRDTGVLASDETFLLESGRLASAQSTGTVVSRSDVVLLFFRGDLTLSTADRVHKVTAPAHAYVNAGIVFEITAGRDDVSYLIATCPASGLEVVKGHDPRAQTGGVTILRTDRYDRFPDSGSVRGGMLFLDEGKTAAYHSHDAAAEVFVFMKGECEAKVDGLSERFAPSDVLYVPAEQKHELANVGDVRLEVWLLVTPNVTPTHTFYEEQTNGTWERVTPRLDGRESFPPSR